MNKKLRNMEYLLNFGSFILMFAIMFVVWSIDESLLGIKLVIGVISALIMLFASFAIDKNLKLTDSAKLFHFESIFLFFWFLLQAAQLGLFGEWIQTDGALVFDSIYCILLGIASILTHVRYKNYLYINLCYAPFILSIYTLFEYLDISFFTTTLVVMLSIFIIYVLKKDLIGFFTPILSFIHVVPTIGISLYLYFFLDKSIIPFILVIMVTVPIMVEGLITAYDNIDKGITDVLKLEQISFFKKLFKIYLPIMTPYILMILLQSFSLGLKAMVMGEYLCMSPKSLGYLIYEAQNALITENMIAILVILFIISIVCEIIIKILQARINKYLLVK